MTPLEQTLRAGIIIDAIRYDARRGVGHGVFYTATDDGGADLPDEAQHILRAWYIGGELKLKWRGKGQFKVTWRETEG